MVMMMMMTLIVTLIVIGPQRMRVMKKGLMILFVLQDVISHCLIWLSK